MFNVSEYSFLELIAILMHVDALVLTASAFLGESFCVLVFGVEVELDQLGEVGSKAVVDFLVDCGGGHWVSHLPDALLDLLLAGVEVSGDDLGDILAVLIYVGGEVLCLRPMRLVLMRLRVSSICFLRYISSLVSADFFSLISAIILALVSVSCWLIMLTICLRISSKSLLNLSRAVLSSFSLILIMLARSYSSSFLRLMSSSSHSRRDRSYIWSYLLTCAKSKLLLLMIEELFLFWCYILCLRFIANYLQSHHQKQQQAAGYQGGWGLRMGRWIGD